MIHPERFKRVDVLEEIQEAEPLRQTREISMTFENFQGWCLDAVKYLATAGVMPLKRQKCEMGKDTGRQGDRDVRDRVIIPKTPFTPFRVNDFKKTGNEITTIVQHPMCKF